MRGEKHRQLNYQCVNNGLLAGPANVEVMAKCDVEFRVIGPLTLQDNEGTLATRPCPPSTLLITYT